MINVNSFFWLIYSLEQDVDDIQIAKVIGNNEGHVAIPTFDHSVDVAMTCDEELHYGLDISVVGQTIQWINARFRDANGVCKSSRLAIS